MTKKLSILSLMCLLCYSSMAQITYNTNYWYNHNYFLNFTTQSDRLENSYAKLGLEGNGGEQITQTSASNYYSVVNGETCATLKTVLHNLIKGHTEVTYSMLWAIFETTDDHLNDSGNETIVWDMYSDNPSGSENEFTFITEQCGSYNGEGECYNREHTFPKSWWGGSTSATQYSDIFVVVPTDGWINGIRSNHPYGEVLPGTETHTTNNQSKVGTSEITIPGYTGEVFEPIDAYKGDFARSFFYMITRYENEIAGWENNTSSSDAVLDGNAYPGAEQWAIDMLITWHNNDSVSQKELDRNDDIFTYQGNRNPFIDHPEYVDLIWGTACSNPCPLDYAGANALTGSESGTKDYETDGVIESKQLINAGAIIDYDSGTSILLDDSFEVRAGALFHAFIDGCGGLMIHETGTVKN